MLQWLPDCASASEGGKRSGGLLLAKYAGSVVRYKEMAGVHGHGL